MEGKAVLGSPVSFLYERVAAKAEYSLCWAWILKPPLIIWVLNLDIPNPFRGNYAKFYYMNNRYFQHLLDTELSEESSGTNFRGISKAYEE